jgi:cell wall-associated NlpC family hydrolase
LTVFISFGYARQRDLKPSDVAINNAISWAQYQFLQPSFPVIGTDLTVWSPFRCGDFVANAYGYPTISYTAGLLWAVSVVPHPWDWNAPRGSLVFFSPNSYNKRMGHVALSTGNGNLIEAGYDVVIRSTIRDENHNQPYLGWAWPPLIWPGRSDVFKATALTWAIQAGKALILTIVSWLIFLIV